MRKLTVFNFLTLNGFYKGSNEDISWHNHGNEEADYAAQGAQSESVLVFGRKTFQMMAGFWPTAEAQKLSPAVADGMNKSEKLVFSKTLTKTDPMVIGWNNSKVIASNLVDEIKKIKKSPGNDLTILGSGTIVAQLADAGLIDQYQFMIDPVVLGDGTSIFHGVSKKINLELVKTKAFKSGVVLHVYQPK